MDEKCLMEDFVERFKTALEKDSSQYELEITGYSSPDVFGGAWDNSFDVHIRSKVLNGMYITVEFQIKNGKIEVKRIKDNLEIVASRDGVADIDEEYVDGFWRMELIIVNKLVELGISNQYLIEFVENANEELDL